MRVVTGYLYVELLSHCDWFLLMIYQRTDAWIVGFHVQIFLLAFIYLNQDYLNTSVSSARIVLQKSQRSQQSFFNSRNLYSTQLHRYSQETFGTLQSGHYGTSDAPEQPTAPPSSTDRSGKKVIFYSGAQIVNYFKIMQS